MRIVFAGTPGFALPSLEAVRQSDHEIVAVITQPDRPAGRGRQLTQSPVKQAAVAADIPVIEAARLKNRESAEQVATLQPDLMVVVAYGAILGRGVLAAPRYGCVNLHGSLLPRWRGAAPIARALLAGDTETGVTLTWMRRALDSGPLIASKPVPIAADATAGSLHDILAERGGQLLADYLALNCVDWPATKQDESVANYATPLTKTEGVINWSAAAAVIVQQIRALQPWPVAYSLLADDNVRIFAAEATNQVSYEMPGTIRAAGTDGVDVASGDFDVRISQLQFPGKKRMTAAEATHGRTLAGCRFD